MPSTWDMYATDGDGDGKSDPYNPHDAIHAAARYLQAGVCDVALVGGTEGVRVYDTADGHLVAQPFAEIQCEVVVDVDEAGDVFRPLDISRHPKDRVRHSA